MMIAFNQMYRGVGDQGFAILAVGSFCEFSFCVLNAMNARNCEHKASPLFYAGTTQCRHAVQQLKRLLFFVAHSGAPYRKLANSSRVATSTTTLIAKTADILRSS